MARNLNIRPEAIGEQTTLPELDTAIAQLSQGSLEAKQNGAGVGAEKTKLEAQNFDEGLADVIVDTLLEVSGGSSALKILKTADEFTTDPASFAGMKTMETLTQDTVSKAPQKVARDMAGYNVRSIHTGYINDIMGRSANSASFLKPEDDEDQIKGFKPSKEAADVLRTQEAQFVANIGRYAKELGYAQQQKLKIGAEMGQTQQMGIMSPGGNVSVARLNNAQNLALNNLAPRGPTDALLRDSTTSET